MLKKGWRIKCLHCVYASLAVCLCVQEKAKKEKESAAKRKSSGGAAPSAKVCGLRGGDGGQMWGEGHLLRHHCLPASCSVVTDMLLCWLRLLLLLLLLQKAKKEAESEDESEVSGWGPRQQRTATAATAAAAAAAAALLPLRAGQAILLLVAAGTQLGAACRLELAVFARSPACCSPRSRLPPRERRRAPTSSRKWWAPRSSGGRPAAAGSARPLSW
jgi:hypothetical protein